MLNNTQRSAHWWWPIANQRLLNSPWQIHQNGVLQIKQDWFCYIWNGQPKCGSRRENFNRAWKGTNNINLSHQIKEITAQLRQAGASPFTGGLPCLKRQSQWRWTNAWAAIKPLRSGWKVLRWPTRSTSIRTHYKAILLKAVAAQWTLRKPSESFSHAFSHRIWSP